MMMLQRRITVFLKRLDRIAGELNAWLLVIAVGLAALDLAVLMALNLSPPRAVSAVNDNAPTATVADVVGGPP